MDKFNPDDLLKSNQPGYNLRQGDVFEWLIAQNIATTLLVSETLRRQLELEELVKTGNVNDDVVQNKMKEITDLIADEATKRKNSAIADLYLRDKEG